MPSTQRPMPRNILTNNQRLAIQAEVRKRRQNGEDNRLQTIAEWAQSEFKLKFQPSQPVLSRLTSTASMHKAIPANDTMRNRRSAQPEIEQRLIQWVNDQNRVGHCLTGDVIREKGKRLLAEVNALLPDEEQISLKFTSGWLWHFQRRWNLKSRKLHGEACDADEVAVERELPNLRKVCQQYHKDDVFNADETGLNYAMPPDRTISVEPMPGRKKEKRRLTILVCANASGTEKYPLLFIGNSKQPRCFKKKSGTQHGFDYSWNKKSWMTMSIFFDWLTRFDSYIRRTPGRNVLLLLDNFSGHGSHSSLPNLECVQVLFLPPNTTSKLQPMDAGIIACLKRRYRSVQYSRALDLLEDNSRSIYKIDQLTAMKYVQAVWNEVPSDVIINCWLTCGVMGRQEVLDVVASEVEDEETENLERTIGGLVGTAHRVSVQDLLNGDDSDYLEELPDADLAKAVVKDIQSSHEDVNNGSDDDEERIKIPFVQQSEILTRAIEVCEDQEIVDLHLIRKLRSLRHSQRRNAVLSMQQSTIDTFFKH